MSHPPEGHDHWHRYDTPSRSKQRVGPESFAPFEKDLGSTLESNLGAYQSKLKESTTEKYGMEKERAKPTAMSAATSNISRHDHSFLLTAQSSVGDLDVRRDLQRNSQESYYKIGTTWQSNHDHDLTGNAGMSLASLPVQSPLRRKLTLEATDHQSASAQSNDYFSGYHETGTSLGEESKVTTMQNGYSLSDREPWTLLNGDVFHTSKADTRLSSIRQKPNAWALTPYQSEFLEQNRSLSGRRVSPLFSATCREEMHALHSGGYGFQLEETSRENGHLSPSDRRLVRIPELKSLSKEELIVQCRLRDQLRTESESHEREMGDLLTETEEKLELVQKENKELQEENKRQQETIRRQSQQLARKESLKQDVATSYSHQLRLVTILFSCQLKDFSVQQGIDQGCEGAVFLVKCTQRGLGMFQDKLFALKTVFNVFGHSTMTKLRSFYQNEYSALCNMQPHENIVRLYAFFYDRIDNNSAFKLPPDAQENARMLSLFLVMEHIPKTLTTAVDELRKEKRLTALQIMKWSRQIFAAVEHMLKYNIIHRDLKLNNVLVTDKGVLKICDFGSSIQLLDNLTLRYEPGGSLGGNPAHAPPEILNAIPGQDIRCQTQDLWASAVMAYEMACRSSPFTYLDQKGYRLADLPDLRLDFGNGDVAQSADTMFPQRFVKLIKSLLEFDASKRPTVQETIAVADELINRTDRETT